MLSISMYHKDWQLRCYLPTTLKVVRKYFEQCKTNDNGHLDDCVLSNISRLKLCASSRDVERSNELLTYVKEKHA